MAYRLAPDTFTQITTTAGLPAVGYTLESYIYNTSTPTAMYTDSSGTSLGTSCTLNSRGAPQTGGGTEVSIFLDTSVAAGYKFVLKDTTGATVRTYAGPVFAMATPSDTADIADGTDAAKGSALVGHYLSGLTGTTATATTARERLNALSNDRLSITDPRIGSADLTGATSSATEIILAHSLGKKVYYPEGSYLFDDTDTNPDFSGGIELDGGAQWKSAEVDDILILDRDGKVIGLHPNFQQSTDTTAITSGFMNTAPVSTASHIGPVEIYAHWYQDFGIDWRRTSGTDTWYNWDWNHTDLAGYDEQRHPTQGWYRGDDTNTLDWQCYWLREAGVTAVDLLPSIDLNVSTWSTLNDRYHWIYQLMNNVPNFKGLKYTLWGQYNGTAGAIQTQWEYIIDNIYLVYNNCYCVRQNGKLYPVIFVFEGANLFANLGNTESAFLTFAEAIADRFIAAGYGGVAMFIRHSKGDFQNSYAKAEAVNCLLFSCDYSSVGARTGLAVTTNETTFEALKDSWTPYHEADAWAVTTSYVTNDIVTRKGWIYAAVSNHTSAATDEPEVGANWATYWYKLGPISREIPCVCTSRFGMAPHPSAGAAGWLAEGTTPELYRDWLQRAVNSALSYKTAPIVTVYNVSEWAEGGPGLMPNRADGWGYLDATRDVLAGAAVQVESLYPRISTDRDQYLAAVGNTIENDADIVNLRSGSALTMTSTPTLRAGFHNQRVTLRCRNAANAITIQDRGTLASSGLYLSANTIALGPNDSIVLEYNQDLPGWVEVSQTNIL